MSAQVQIQQTLNGSSSARISTYDEFKVKDLPYTSTFMASVPVAIPKPTIPESADMTDAMERHLSDIVNGRNSPQAGLDSLALELQRLLGNKARLRYPIKATR
jgi:ABC-type glycerol-3-phosphate transport system substrate-binding protein